MQEKNQAVPKVIVVDAEGYVRAIATRAITQDERERQEFLLLKRIAAQAESVSLPSPETQVKA
jgi:hypothetical protein